MSSLPLTPAIVIHTLDEVLELNLDPFLCLPVRILHDFVQELDDVWVYFCQLCYQLQRDHLYMDLLL